MQRFGDLIIRTKLVLPRLRRYLLPRPDLATRLLEAKHYPLTIVQASTGYGKSTALVAAMQQASLRTFWYSIAETDRDPFLFLLHLIHAFRMQLPELGDRAMLLLEEVDSPVHSLLRIVQVFSNELLEGLTAESVLVLDDYHLVSASPQVNQIVDRFLEVMPPRLHLIISTRHRPLLQSLVPLRAKAGLLEVGQGELAFSDHEIETLFRTQYGLKLNPHQVRRLASETEGWIIAIQMIWQSLQRKGAETLDRILEELPRSLEDLFTYLAQDVLARLPAHMQDFLLSTAVLRQLDVGACDALLGWEGSDAVLRGLDEDGFFLVRMGDVFRYHHLFHDFLRRQVERDGERARALQCTAAAFYQQRGNFEEAIFHWLAAGKCETAASIMARMSKSLVDGGRIDTLSEWVTALPPAALEQFPILMVHMGELCRFASRFEEALAWYEQAKERYQSQHDVAGASRALRGQAAVYLDTVRPIRAEALLQDALRLVDGQPDREERARLLELMAENMTNRGRWEEADSLRHQARELREEGPGAADLDVRVLLRTGRLENARALLVERAAAELRTLPQDHFREPRAHRETLLLLSLIHAWQGNADESYRCAMDGIVVGQRLGSPFVEAVGLMRLGHAWQITPHPESAERALACYQQAIEIGERLDVQRTKVEALWGLVRLHGYGGDLESAERNAQEGIQVAHSVGDEWIAALIEVTMGASYALAGEEEAADGWLARSEMAYRDLGDPFGRTVAQLWQALLDHQRGRRTFLACLDEALNLVEHNGYSFLFGHKTFLGPPDPQALIPLLVIARQHSDELASSRYAGLLLQELGLPPDLAFHPGYTLSVQTLGGFAVHRGREPVSGSDWRRGKARQLFHLFLANRGRFVQREEIIAALWPDADPTAGERQFKVTLNALQQALEPERPPRAPTQFVKRVESAYGIDRVAPVFIDAAEFGFSSTFGQHGVLLVWLKCPPWKSFIRS